MDTLRLDIPTIAITGSAGKTTTKEMIASILDTKWDIFKSYKNNNNPSLHTKKHAQMIEPWHQGVVLEYGMSREGFGKQHCSYIEPNISIITSIGFAHMGALGGNLENIVEAKSALFKYMKPTGTLLINSDDENSKLLQTDSFKGQMITVGIKNKADYQAINVTFLDNGMLFQVLLDNHLEEFFIPCFGNFNVINALFAIAVSHRLHFTPSEIRKGLMNFEKPVRRLFVKHLRENAILVDDSYSANPQAVKAAIDVLSEIGKDKKKVVILGSMLELGHYSTKFHEDIGKYVVMNKIDTILTYGKDAKSIGDGALSAGHPLAKLFHFEDRELLHAHIGDITTSNAAILVKGSNGMKMNMTVKYLVKKNGLKKKN
ncbi:UDP-N-acetylmuramoyl-tripeptide--D-alanyl-D-alanine ligase [Virgibacillus natechei]|uniref:UDP-N-acetylmuramoyl-tripeptide--D-alanyl-D-alanine ligase n=1 Tax=Virgibacillus natechei TaxID=1216297 RepID=A0ABS4ICL9_9BACI|nr:UDP-N-acetylmuramoyl-tripeptide--D-alanyl-D-alanine ligase [Virgibacillus natechei]MBP1968390.1 UDP-N-acetylmuramoyl-tripeptide--D-alanyl-D-alanine ligase [Virgibacillus natechei]UZD13516.1 UDP-N-acetylmuramoyl-tripeptide--D-alanyl-D-alanine ligase [Virgibacillus natechei]